MSGSWATGNYGKGPPKAQQISEEPFCCRKSSQLQCATHFKGASPGPYYHMSVAGEFMFAPRKFPDMHANIFLLTTGCAGAMAKRFEIQNLLSSCAPAGSIEAALRLHSNQDPAATNRGWWPISNSEGKSASPSGYWPADELAWDYDRPYVAPKISRNQLRYSEKQIWLRASLSYSPQF